MAYELEDKLDRLAQAGSVARTSVGKDDWTWQVDGLEPGTEERLLAEVRAERES